MADTILKKLSENLAQWDKQLADFKAKAANSAGDKKADLDKLSAEVAQQAAQLKAKIDELKNKNPDEIKAQAEELMRSASGKIGEGLGKLAKFFESKSNP